MRPCPTPSSPVMFSSSQSTVPYTGTTVPSAMMAITSAAASTSVSSCGHTIETTTSVWASILLSAIGIPLCIHFTRRTWHGWMLFLNPPTLKGPNQSASGTSESSNGLVKNQTGSFHPPVLHGGGAFGGASSQHNHNGSHHSIHSTGATSPFFFLPTIRLRLPKNRNEGMVMLLLASWITFTTDQVFDLVYQVTLALSCPQYNCIQALVLMPGCLAEPISMIQTYLQPLGSALFVLATMNRFINVYSVLSRPRLIVIRTGSVIVVLITIFRWATIPFLYMLETIPTGAEGRETRFARLASVLYSAGFYSSYLVYSVFDLSSLAMGIQYILHTQKEVDEVRGKSTAVLNTMNGGEQYGTVSMLQSTPNALASGIMASAPSTSVIHNNSGGMLIPSTSAAPGGTAASGSPPSTPTTPPPPPSFVKRVSTALSEIPRRPPSEVQPSDVVFWIVACFVVLLGFLAIQGYPGVLATQPAQLSFALMTLMLKIFGVCMSMSITRMTQLVTRKRKPRGSARNRGQSSNQQATSGMSGA